MLPSYTGQILDSVIPGHDDPSKFRTAMTAFIAFNVALGITSGASRLMFSIVSQRMEIDLRTTMFRRILGQSIDFFDNATTGDLLASLNDDVRNMLAPIQMYVPRVFGAVLTLTGGLVRDYLLCVVVVVYIICR
jgi:ABC-type multidrug transport system fused ATPase/permease subunit